MSSVIEIAAEEDAGSAVDSESSLREGSAEEQPSAEGLSENLLVQEVVQQTWHERQAAAEDRERERRTYHGRTVAMLRRYMRYSIETGRLPSVLGREFFRAKVTSYTVITFEDRVIFVLDMEKCLQRLDEFSRQLIARHILQEHDQEATSKLLGCAERTVRTYVLIALDLMSEILIEVGLMEPLDSRRRNSCQGVEND
jgi:DNA-directed RNA polymerase specialized sigma24 family protein